MTIASSGGLPVRYPTPKIAQLAALHPYSHDAAAFTCTL